MAVLFVSVDILVGQIDAAGEADVAVDDADLAVVAGVEAAGEDRHKGVKDATLDAHLLEGLVVAGGQDHDAAHVVVDDPHVHPLRRLLAQDVQDGVPHLALLDDEIFQEDVVLGLL